MTFDINAVVAQAISTGLDHYKEHLLAKPKQADVLKSKHDAILKNIDESFNYPHLQAEAAQLLIDSFPTFERWGYWADCIEICKFALTLELAKEQQVWLHANLAHAYLLNRNFDDSLFHLNAGLALAEEHQVEHLFGLIHHRFMNTFIGKQAYETAQEHGLRALTYLAGQPSKTLAAAYDSLGRVAIDLNNLTLAEKYICDALLLWEKLEDYTHLARSRANLGFVYLGQKNWVKAKNCFEISLDILKNLSNTLDEIKAKNGLGIVHYSIEAYGTAAQFFLAAANQLEAELSGDAGWYDMHGSLLHNIGNSQLAIGDTQQALYYLDKAKTVWLQASNNLEMGNTVGTMAEAYQVEERWETAVATYNEALNLLAQFPNHPWAVKLTNNFTLEKQKCAERLDNNRSAQT